MKPVTMFGDDEALKREVKSVIGNMFLRQRGRKLSNTKFIINISQKRIDMMIEAFSSQTVKSSKQLMEYVTNKFPEILYFNKGSRSFVIKYTTEPQE